MWTKIDEIFPEGGTYLNGIYYTNNAIKNSHLSKLTIPIIKPVRKMLENIIEYTYYSNNNLSVKTTYNIFPPQNIDNIPLLNVYGFKILNNLKED